MDKEVLLNKKLFLLDMDGTIYLDNILFENSLNFLNHIKNIGGQYVFLTNNSSKSVSDYITKLRSLSISAGIENFMTSSQATVLYLKEHYNEKKIYVVGTNSFKKELLENNLNIVDKLEDNIECLVVGFDTELTYQKLTDACRLLTLGVDYIGTNPDMLCPTSFGFAPDCGSICQMLEIATNRVPEFIGKPKPIMVELAMQASGFSRDETIVIGDRLYTDIACGINSGVTTGVVLTGETKKKDLKDTEFKPDFVFKTISELYNIINP
ncbi:MAG: HAD-IIA family hydrolase [Alphaproteobacteria bacterium]